MEGPGYLAVTITPGPTTDPSALEDWYTHEHGPLRLRLPFITTGYRYHASDDLQPEWLACYDVTDLSMLEKRIYTRLREERSVREKEVMATFKNLDRRIYSLVKRYGGNYLPDGGVKGAGVQRGAAPMQVAVSFRQKEKDLEEWIRWFEEEQVPLISKVPGWLGVSRFRLQVGGINGMPGEGEIEELIVHLYEQENGYGGPEWQAAHAEGGLRGEVMSRILAKEKRQWRHHFTFDPLQEPPSTVLTTDGAELPFQLLGNPSDPVIVCVNSILTNFHIWDDVATHLTTKGINGQTYRVLRYNSRGYAKQPPNGNPTRFDLLADDLEYLLQRTNIAKAHAVLGVSMGGVTALNFALRHPEMVGKFISCDCNVASSEANNSAWAERIALAKKEPDGLKELAEMTVKRWFTPPNHGSGELEKVRGMVEAASVEGFEQQAGALCNYDLKPILKDCKVPGLLVVGEGDGKLPQAMGGFGIPDTRLEVIPQAGHLPMLENHDAFMKALEGFL